MRRLEIAALVTASMVTSGPLHAADIPVAPNKLIVMDKLARAGKARVVYVAKDAALAKYANKAAPGGPTETKVAVIKPGKLLKLVAKGLGDTPLDILGAGDPGGPVATALCVDNGGEESCHCSELAGCAWKSIARATGAKLVCKTGVGDSTWHAIRCTEGLVDRGLTVLDPCTNVGSGADPSNLNDVDNVYITAGECTLSGATCQPNAAAVATCVAQTDGIFECGEECGTFEGTCYVAPPASTTIWDWVNRLNESGFAGKRDWRPPKSAGYCEWPTGEPGELESIRDVTQGSCGGGVGPCIDPIFGPTANLYSSASRWAPNSGGVWLVSFRDVENPMFGALAFATVRAVRDGS